MDEIMLETFHWSISYPRTAICGNIIQNNFLEINRPCVTPVCTPFAMKNLCAPAVNNDGTINQRVSRLFQKTKDNFSR